MTVDDSRVRRPGGRTRLVTERLRAAALEIVAENGIDGLQYEELASRAQVGRATVYRRWPNRDDLFRDVLTHFAETSVQIEDTGDIVRDLTVFLHSFAEASVTPAGRAVLQILLRRVDTQDGLHRVGVELLDRRTGELQSRLDRATEVGQLPPVEASFVNMMLVGPVQWFVLRRERPFALDDAREIVELVLAGLRRRDVG
ncbi:TetR/AcrR family transcriptional regulator [Microbacterium sp. NPDC087591]|uniref:TetR/AcrR family transcriptional regulator n=1 Tax=Microbacterium sp. NPDC087591 TaxID=3364192 RepID=UPI003815AAAA